MLAKGSSFRRGDYVGCPAWTLNDGTIYGMNKVSERKLLPELIPVWQSQTGRTTRVSSAQV
jgi:hypothetical protein